MLYPEVVFQFAYKLVNSISSDSDIQSYYFDLDEDRSITSSIATTLKYAGIDAVVDGEEMNASVFYVYTKSNRATVEDALKNHK